MAPVQRCRRNLDHEDRHVRCIMGVGGCGFVPVKIRITGSSTTTEHEYTIKVGGTEVYWAPVLEHFYWTAIQF